MTDEVIDKVLTNPEFIVDLTLKLKEERKLKELALEEKRQLEITLEKNNEWFSTKRVTRFLKIRDLNVWRALKNTAVRIQKTREVLSSSDYNPEITCERKEVFDSNYGKVNSYHCSLWQEVYNFDPRNLKSMSSEEKINLGNKILRAVDSKFWRNLK